MKKVLLPICAMLLCMTACNKEENNGILRLEVEHYTSDAKLHLDAAHFAVWDNNDEVLLNGVRKPVTISNGTATISDVATDNNYYAVYPSSWATSTTSTTSINYPEYQFNFNGRVIAPMAATYNNEKLVFKNLGAILAVNVNTAMTVDRIEVVAEDNVLLSGTFPIGYGGARPTAGTPTSGKNMTTLICDTVVPSTGMTFYIALPAVTAQLTVKVYSGTTCYSKSHNSPFTLQANHGYSVNLSDFTSSTIDLPNSNQIFYTASSQINANNLKNAVGYNLVTFNVSVTSQVQVETGKWVVTFNKDISKIVASTSGSQAATFLNGITSITLPESVTSIENFAFINCSTLVSIIAPGVTGAGTSAFRNCTNLTTISMPKVTSLGNRSISECTNLTTVSMPKLITMSDYSFEDCTSLKTVSVPNLKYIKQYAFSGCTAITDIYCTRTSVPTELGKNAFNQVPNTARLHLPLSKYNNLVWSKSSIIGTVSWPGKYYYDL